MKVIKFLAVIPARKNSKRIKNKNLIKYKGVPLVKHTLNQISKLKDIKLSVLSSDSDKILKYSNKIKNCIAIKRPNKISKDNSSTEDAILHAISVIEKKGFKIENIILLQVTSPFRTSKDIKNCIDEFKKRKYISIFSSYSKKSFIWQKKNKTLKSLSYNFKNRIRSQKLKNLYYENGAIYIFDCKKFKKIKNRIMKPFGTYLMSEQNSLDLDSKDDLIFLRKGIK